MMFMKFMLLLLTAAVHEVQSQVVFTDTSAILYCPETGEVVKWKVKDQSELQQQTELTVEAKDGSVSGTFTCDADGKKHQFYIKSKVCKNCYELNAGLASGVIIGDLLLTGGVILLVYLCTQRKSDNTKQRDAPRPPNPDYAPLNPKTQTRDLYAGIR
ncbi:T-cell surface glycoprotein CD3 epsilon chain-like [Paramisgurnus dabryanus]|uniref:T-cell surface glycoprotein CD3 epsilon chain-like n=1 Tax=Paramisgurnus dabryanus TaxID=90735 RepID=UPI0031F4161A